MKKLFKTERVIFSKRFKPAKMVEAFAVGRNKYVRVVFTNSLTAAGKVEVVDIPYHEIIGIRTLPSPFKKWCFKMVGLKAKPIHTHLKN